MKRIGPINGDSLISHDEAELITYLRLKMKFNGNSIRYFTCVD